MFGYGITFDPLSRLCTTVVLQGADLREGDVSLLPLQALDGKALLPQVGFQLGAKLVWNATAWSAHGSVTHISHTGHTEAKNTISGSVAYDKMAS